jgi:ATP-dependent helicase HepA
MPLDVIGQRCVSEREPELGLGVVASFEGAHLGVVFPASGEKRLYKRNTPVLKRVLFHVGDTVSARGGERLVVESVVEEAGLLVYCGGGQRLREDAVSDLASVLLPQARLLAGQAEPGEVFDLRQRALQAQATLRQSPLRGFMGGRIDLIPHQFFILREVAARAVPRVLLADEVGLGKTIEACLIVQRLLAVGRAKRVLVLVPESLVHQWFVELLRRFNLWFSILDEQRCLAAEPGAPEGNPFLGQQLALCSLAFLAGDEARGAQAVSAGWDIVVVDEAHHLEWAPGAPSPEYTLVEHLSFRSPGLLLLTATPTQLGLPGHFARLRLLDPNRYADYATFLAETEAFVGVAAVAEHLVEEKPLKARELAALKRIFQRAPEALARHLAALEARTPGAREALLRTLVDQHGPGRVMFRNTRAAMTGFPRRKFCPALLAGADPTLLARCARELEAEETGGRPVSAIHTRTIRASNGWLVFCASTARRRCCSSAAPNAKWRPSPPRCRRRSTSRPASFTKGFRWYSATARRRGLPSPTARGCSSARRSAARAATSSSPTTSCSSICRSIPRWSNNASAGSTASARPRPSRSTPPASAAARRSVS